MDSVFILCLVWFTWGFGMFAAGQALTFTIQQYDHDPRAIAFVTTFSGFLMLGPFYSYLSDTIWTRSGRRRPFLFVAWTGAILGMFALAFLPQVLSSLNFTFGLVGIGPFANIVLLAGIIFCYSKMWEFAGPMEPFFVECVPPHQRGRFFAMRGIVYTLAVMFFYQILWPVYDDQVDMWAPLGFPHLLVLKGEKIIYILAGSLFTITGLYLFFCTEEVKQASAPNKTLREVFLGPELSPHSAPLAPLASGWKGFIERLNRIPVVTFGVGFFRSVIASPANYPFYIVAIIPGLGSAVWGNFMALMLNDQFGYSKANQSLYAFPFGLLSMFIMTPFAGWYSDIRIDLKWHYRLLLLGFSAACFACTGCIYRIYSPTDIRELPALWVMFTITLLLGVAVISCFVPLVETVLDFVGRGHARFWISFVAIFKGIALSVATYIVVLNAPHHVPSILTWMVLFCLGGAVDALVNTFCAPMLFDYIPRSDLGIFAAGSGIYGTISGLIMANLGAWWVVFYSSTFVKHLDASNKATYDYTGLYLIGFAFAIPAVLAKGYFAWLIIKGRMKKIGEMEVENPAKLEQAS